MPYATKEDILKRIKKTEYDKLTESDVEGLTADMICESAISDADSLINGYLKSAAVALPLAEAPESIKKCSVDIAVFNLHARIQYADIPQYWKDRYDTAIAFLKDISKGYAGLDQKVTESETEARVNVSQEERQFNRTVF